MIVIEKIDRRVVYGATATGDISHGSYDFKF